MTTYVTLTCVECGKDTTTELVPAVPAYRRGHPDNWTPPEAGYIEDEKCEHCGFELPTEGLPL